VATRRHARSVRPAVRPLAQIWAELRAAATFLTRLSIHRPTDDLDRTGAAAFAIVGAAIGLVGAIPLLLLGPRLPLPAAVLAILAIVLLSGGMHLDGLADTADALAAPTADAAERARNDPQAGAAGVAAIALDLLLGGALLGAVTAADPRLAAAGFVVATTGSRAAPPVAALTERTRRIRREDGLGGWFAARIGPLDAVASVFTTVVVTVCAALVAGPTVVVFGTAAGLVVAGISSAAIVARRGQLDGDGYGAIVEITFVAILAGIAVQVPVS
jgi:adenosylcobinamide-GDP ribazoletransferase